MILLKSVLHQSLKEERKKGKKWIYFFLYLSRPTLLVALTELPQAQSIEVVRIYVQQMIGRNEWGQGIILKPPVAREWLHRLHLLFVDNYIPISLEQFEVPLYLSY